MELKLLYYPGCSVKRNAPEYEKSALSVLRAAGYEVIELDNWYCCGALYSLARDDLMKHVGGLRTLVKAQVQGRQCGTSRLLTLCPMCYNVLKRVNNMLRNSPESLETLSLFMDEEERYALGVDVVHLVEVLKESVEKLKPNVREVAKDVVVASYYGCTLVRPKEVAVDDAENPEIVEKTLKALGFKVVDDFPLKTECCGSYHAVFNRKIAVEKSLEILKEAVAAGANTVVVVCPLCMYNLTLALKTEGRRLGVSVVYLTDLLARVLEPR